ncbi:early endosome antigen 1-like, partial [Ylistrum balloti]|uniref:early endosome antigen 1-like n=1 Tax=Ylistrum balloti TaxID=509963 RepID=UPI0029058DB7
QENYQILLDIFRDHKTMFPDSWIFEIEQLAPITSQPKSISRDSTSSSGEDYWKNEVTRLHSIIQTREKNIEDLEWDLKTTQKKLRDIENSIKHDPETEYQQKSLTKNWTLEEETRPKSGLQQSGIYDEQQQSTQEKELEKLKETQRSIDTLKEKIIVLQQGRQLDSEKLNKEVNLRQATQQDNEKLRRQLTESREEMENLIKERTVHEANVQKLQHDLETLQEDKQRDHEKLRRSVPQDTRSQDKMHFTGQGELPILQEEIKLTQTNLNHQQELFNVELENASSKIKALENREEALQSELDDKEKRICELVYEKEKMMKDLERHQQMHEDINSQLLKLQQDNNSKTSSIGTLLEDKEQLTQQLDERSKAIQDAETLIDKLSIQTTNLESEKEDIANIRRGQIEKLTEETRKMSFTITELRKELQTLEKQMGDNENKLKTVQLNKDQLTQDLETERQEYLNTRTDLEEQIVVLKEDNTAISSTVENLKQNVVELERQMGSARATQQTLTRTKESLEEEIRALQNEKQKIMKDMQANLDDFRAANVDLVSKMDVLKKEKETLQEKLSKTSTALQDAEIHTDMLLAQTTSLQREKEDMEKHSRGQIENLTEEKGKMSTTITELQKERQTLEKQIGSLQATLLVLNVEKETLEKEAATLREAKQELYSDMSAKLNDLRAMNSTLTSNIDALKEEKETIQEKFDAKDDELKTIQREMREAAERAKRKSIVLSLRSERSGMGKTMVDMVTREVTKSLDGKVDKTCMDLTIQPYQSSAGTPYGPVVVLCLNMSRVGTNIQDALKGITANKDVIVLVLHHTSKDNLSSLTPTSLRVTGSELRQLGGILDMAFSSDSGLYECKLNDTAMEKLATILKKY